jgi:hypothetical protein
MAPSAPRWLLLIRVGSGVLQVRDAGRLVVSDIDQTAANVASRAKK